MTRKTMIVTIAALGLGLAAGCSSEDAESVANQAEQAGSRLADVAAGAGERAEAAAGRLAGSAVEACRELAERGAWGDALEVCRKAHELRPDDLQLENAYQQARAAAAE